jgi:signal transduction histidine kinase
MATTARLLHDFYEPLSATLMQLVDELPFGVMQLDESGTILEANDTARHLLQSSWGDQIQDALREVCAQGGPIGRPAEYVLGMSPSAQIRLLLARSPDRRCLLAVIERGVEARLQNEIRSLGAMLTLTAQAPSPREAAARALKTMAASLPGCALVLHEQDGSERTLLCTAEAGVTSARAALRDPKPLDLRESTISRVAVLGQPAHVPDLGRSPFEADRAISGADRLVLLAMPVRAGGRVLGVLSVCGPDGVLGESELRLVQGLTNAVGTLLERARLVSETAAGRAVRHSLEADVRRAQEVATRREELAAIGQLAAGVAHEINNPLSFVKSNFATMAEHISELNARMESARSALTDGPAQGRLSVSEILSDLAEIAEESRSGIERIAHIVQALKGMARTRTNDRMEFNPAQAIHDAVIIFRGAKRGCNVEVEIGQLPPVRGSPGAVGQVLLNLLDNALDSMGGSGTIQVRAEEVDQKLRITVRDQGTGIPLEVQARMFEPFFTTKEQGKGTGLGLFICYEIVKQMAGEISFDTGPTGTTFAVELPVADD